MPRELLLERSNAEAASPRQGAAAFAATCRGRVATPWSRQPAVASLRDWARRIAARRGHKVAAVALARRLAGIMYALMRDQASYEPSRINSPKEVRTKAA